MSEGLERRGGAWNPGPRLRHRNGTRDLKARVRHDLRKITDAND